MEIDFLGLGSKDSSYNFVKNQSSTVNPFIDSGGDISLSLCTISPLDSQTELPYFNKRNTRRFSSSCDYCPENAATTEQSDRYTRNIQENSSQPAAALLTILCPATPHYIYAQKIDRCTKIVGNESLDKPRKCNRGYSTPTVAMARRATLARFLQKRSHRLKQTRTANLMGIPLY